LDTIPNPKSPIPNPQKIRIFDYNKKLKNLN